MATKVKLIADNVITTDQIDLTSISTTNISEGDNLYYTDARVGAYLTANSYATQSYVGTELANLVDSSPATLDTLNELAAALGDDPNFATTVTNSIGTKWTQDNIKISNWDTSYTYSQVGHVPLAGGTMTGTLTTAAQTWAGHITWNTGQNIYVAGESSIDVSGAGYFQLWDSSIGAAFLKVDPGQTTEIGEAGTNGLKVFGITNSTAGFQVNGTSVIDASRAITASALAINNNAAHTYLYLNSTGGYEQMVRFKNGITNDWYAGIRTSAGIASTADFHIYSAALGNDVFALNTTGDAFVNRNLLTEGVYNRTGSDGLKVGNFTDANTDETGGSVITWLRTGTWDNYLIKGSTGRGVFGTQFIGEHISDSKSWGVFSTNWDTEMQVNGDGRLYMKGPVGIGYTPTSTSDYRLKVGGKTCVESTGTGTTPTLDVINTSATTFNHSMEVMAPNMTTGQTNILVLGRESSTRNAGYLGYNFSGTAGSYDNYISIGLWGNDNLFRFYPAGDFHNHVGNILKTVYNKAYLLQSSGTSSSGSAIGFQQLTAEGWSGIFVDYNPYEGWGLYHDNPSNFFYITAELSTNNIGTSFTVPNRNSGTSTAYAKIRFNQNNGNIDLGGNLVAYGSVTANASDQRLKENLIPIENAVEKIKRLNGLYFDWKADLIDSVGFSPDIRENDVGLIAQEVQAVLPQAVTRAPFDTKVVSTPIDRKNKNAGNVEEYSSLTGEEYLTIRYEKLVPLLVAAIKEQAEKIEALEARVQQLET